MTENVAVLAPTPRAVRRMMAIAKLRDPLSVRAVYRRSCTRIAQCAAMALGTTSAIAAKIPPMRPCWRTISSYVRSSSAEYSTRKELG